MEVKSGVGWNRLVSEGGKDEVYYLVRSYLELGCCFIRGKWSKRM